MQIADIGSGFGDCAARFAAAVGPTGAVEGVDAAADLRQEVARRAPHLGLAQLRTVAGQDDDPGIPEPVDLVFLSSSCHHLPDRVRYVERVRGDLCPGGRVAILEGSMGLNTGWFGHATGPDEVVATLTAAGFRRL